MFSHFEALIKALKDSSKNSAKLHHAYGIEGDASHIELLKSTLKNEEVHIVIEDSFGIDEGRKLQEIALLRPQGSGDRKYIIVHGRVFTREAQNALLKLFEEPTASTHFLLVLPSFDAFLPTLKSRLNIIVQSRAEQSNSLESEHDRVTTFLVSGPGARLAIVKDMLEDLDKEKISRADIERFLRALEHAAHTTFKAQKTDSAQSIISLAVFEKFLTTISYAGDRSSSIKMILESIALILPILPTV